jgi:hypothetical protein
MADKKISQLTAASTPLTGTEELAIVQSGSTVKATAQDIADLAPAPSLGYLVYSALIRQTPLNEIVTTVLNNTVGFTPSFAQSGTGSYRAEVPTSIDLQKIIILCSSPGLNNVGGNSFVFVSSTVTTAGPNPYYYFNLRLDGVDTSTGILTPVNINNTGRSVYLELRIYP